MIYEICACPLNLRATNGFNGLALIQILCMLQLSRIRKVELGAPAHTIKSHGAALAMNHKHDWLILLFLAMVEVSLLITHPFHRFVGKDMMEDLKYPMKDNTVPVWAVPVSIFFLKCCYVNSIIIYKELRQCLYSTRKFICCCKTFYQLCSVFNSFVI